MFFEPQRAYLLTTNGLPVSRLPRGGTPTSLTPSPDPVPQSRRPGAHDIGAWAAGARLARGGLVAVVALEDDGPADEQLAARRRGQRVVAHLRHRLQAGLQQRQRAAHRLRVRLPRNHTFINCRANPKRRRVVQQYVTFNWLRQQPASRPISSTSSSHASSPCIACEAAIVVTKQAEGIRVPYTNPKPSNKKRGDRTVQRGRPLQDRYVWKTQALGDSLTPREQRCTAHRRWQGDEGAAAGLGQAVALHDGRTHGHLRSDRPLSGELHSQVNADGSRFCTSESAWRARMLYATARDRDQGLAVARAFTLP